ncbi:MAG: hypothetical protein ACI89J_003842 [Hyphomicrobiaceae bacterium]|jgi:hypothetical protein
MIKKTFHDGNPEDWHYTGDFWNWIRKQPQDVWLLWARHANWDSADSIFERMVDDPRCDGALASWIFWNAEPGYHYANPDHYSKNPGAFDNSLVGRIMKNAQRGYYKDAELYYDRYEVVIHANLLATAIEEDENRNTFQVPKVLFGPFDGRHAKAPEFDIETQNDLEEFFDAMDGWLPLSEAEHSKYMRSSGHLRIAKYLHLPKIPAATAALASVNDNWSCIQAVFGSSAAIKNARMERGFSRGEMMAVRILAIGSPILIAAALIAHRLQIGSW